MFCSNGHGGMEGEWTHFEQDGLDVFKKELIFELDKEYYTEESAKGYEFKGRKTSVVRSNH